MVVQLRDVAYWNGVREQWSYLGHLFDVEFIRLDVERKYQNKSRLVGFGLSGVVIFLEEEDLDWADSYA